MKIIISAHAQKDLTAIFAYLIQQFGEVTAAIFAASFDTFFDTLRHNPELGSQVTIMEDTVQVFFFQKYAVICRVQDDIQIIRIIHQSRDYMQILNT